MLKIGLTGGIGSGKSTVATQFAQLGIEIIDADLIAHQLSEPTGACYQSIVEHFGEGVLLENGRLNRKRLRKLAFEHPKQRAWLEQTLHPAILTHLKTRLDKAKPPYCIAVLPLLIEAKLTTLFDRILVVDVPEKIQLERTRQRDHLSEAEVKKILNTQCKRQERLKYANDIIDTTMELDQLTVKIEQLHAHYCKL